MLNSHHFYTNALLCFLSADTSKTSSRLRLLGCFTRLTELLKCPNRDAPHLLGYTPTYQHFSKLKKKTDQLTMPRGFDLKKLAAKEYQAKKMAQDASSAYKVADSAIPAAGGSMPPPREVAKQKAPAPSDPPPAKKAKITEASSALPEKAEQTKTAPSSKKGKDKERGTAEDVGHNDVSVPSPVKGKEKKARPFKPSLMLPDARVITEEDSVSEDFSVAVTLLQAMSLPEDRKEVPTNWEHNMAEICQLVAKVNVPPCFHCCYESLLIMQFILTLLFPFSSACIPGGLTSNASAG